MNEEWRISASSLKTLRGMIIDRDEYWRPDAEMAPVIDAAIRKGLKRIDEPTHERIYWFLRYGPMGDDGQRHPLDGSYETQGFDEQEMAKAWRRYYRKNYPKTVDALKA